MLYRNNVDLDCLLGDWKTGKFISHTHLPSEVHIPVNDTKLVQELEDTREGETIILL